MLELSSRYIRHSYVCGRRLVMCRYIILGVEIGIIQVRVCGTDAVVCM